MDKVTIEVAIDRDLLDEAERRGVDVQAEAEHGLRRKLGRAPPLTHDEKAAIEDSIEAVQRACRAPRPVCGPVASLLISQCDVFRNPGIPDDAVPFVVVLQADAVHWTSSVVVAPLVTVGIAADSRLTPMFSVAGLTCALMVSDLAPVPRRLLVERIANLVEERDRIVAALDLLFIGF